MKYQAVELIVDLKPVMDSTREYNNLYSELSYINLFCIFLYIYCIGMILLS